MHNPEKKERTISATDEAPILGFSASMFMARRRCKWGTILRHDPVSFIRKNRKLPHGIDGKAPLLFPLVERTILKKSLDVLPAKRLPGEKSSLFLAVQVVPQARYK